MAIKGLRETKRGQKTFLAILEDIMIGSQRELIQALDRYYNSNKYPKRNATLPPAICLLFNIFMVILVVIGP